jgi:hypothetical protein
MLNYTQRMLVNYSLLAPLIISQIKNQSINESLAGKEKPRNFYEARGGDFCG